MDSLTIELDRDMIEALRLRAEERGLSVEQEARNLIVESVRPVPAPKRRLTEAELNALGVPLEEPFDLKAWSDEAWEAGLK